MMTPFFIDYFHDYAFAIAMPPFRYRPHSHCFRRHDATPIIFTPTPCHITITPIIFADEPAAAIAIASHFRRCQPDS